MLQIIQLSEEKLGIENLEIEVEYQTTTIGKYDLDFNGEIFLLKNKTTACLAEDSCGIPTEKLKVRTANKNDAPCCSPDGNCC